MEKRQATELKKFTKTTDKNPQIDFNCPEFVVYENQQGVIEDIMLLERINPSVPGHADIVFTISLINPYSDNWTFISQRDGRAWYFNESIRIATREEKDYLKEKVIQWLKEL